MTKMTQTQSRKSPCWSLCWPSLPSQSSLCPWPASDSATPDLPRRKETRGPGEMMRSDGRRFRAFNYRSQSRSGTLSSSRRSSASRRGEERWREGEQLEEKLERMMNYSNNKPRLSPLIEVIEPTPPLCRNAPIFGMTGESNLSQVKRVCWTKPCYNMSTFQSG